MDKNNINISKIETFLNGLIDNKVSGNTFFTALPDKSVIDASNWQDMVLVEIPNGVMDFDAYGQGTVLIWLYARPLESGRKNVAKMSELEKKLNEVVASYSSTNYAIKRRYTYTDYDTDIKWHCNAVEILITIV